MQRQGETPSSSDQVSACFSTGVALTPLATVITLSQAFSVSHDKQQVKQAGGSKTRRVHAVTSKAAAEFSYFFKLNKSSFLAEIYLEHS